MCVSQNHSRTTQTKFVWSLLVQHLFHGPSDVTCDNLHCTFDLQCSTRVYGLLLPCALFCAGSQATNGTSASQSSFAMKGPMVALLMPFKPDSLEVDDASFIKYLEVGLKHVASQKIDCS